MYFTLMTVTTLVALVAGHDVKVGIQNGGKKVYDQNITASPAIWRQVQTVFVNATEGDVIGRISITDNRADKNGIVSIPEGGVGKKNVTIELKSPTIFRGLDFSVDVYTVREEEYLANEAESQNVTIDDDTKVNENSTEITEGSTENVMTVNSTDKLPEPHKDEEVKVPTIAGMNPTDTKTQTNEEGSGDSNLDTLVASIFSSTTSATLVKDPVNPTVITMEPVKQILPDVPSGVKTKN